MARIKISTKGKKDPEEQADEPNPAICYCDGPDDRVCYYPHPAPEAEVTVEDLEDEWTPKAEMHPQDGEVWTAEDEPEDESEVEELAKGMAKDVADKVTKAKEAPLTRKVVDRANPDEDLNIDPDKNYPKIAMIRVTMGDDDSQEMDDWLDVVKDAIKDVTKNATVLTTHRLINGKQVANHRYEEEKK